jgi:glycosyltransferase involved in cell wall biosynthesis
VFIYTCYSFIHNLSRSKLILVTAGFPFGNSETFLETEIKYLCEGFEQVQILSVDPKSETIRTVPANCSVSALHTQSGISKKLKALGGIFDQRTLGEFKIIHRSYGLPLNKGILSTLLISLQRAKDIQQQILPYIENVNETVLYSYWCDDSALALAMLSEERKELKTICRIHRWDVYFDQSAVGYLPFRHYIYDHLSTIYSISEDGINYAKKVWKVSGEKLKLSRLGIEAQEPLQKRIDGVFTIVSCSNLIPVKRVHLITEAVKELDGQLPLRWVHIGDGPERDRIENLTHGLSSKTKVDLVGRLSNPDVYKLYRELAPDLFINVSSSEGIPVSIMEAMSFGIPVIATDVGGNGEIVNEENGELLPVLIDAVLLRNKILKHQSSDPKKQLVLKEGAYSTWKSFYNAALNYSEFVNTLQTL